MRKSAYGAEVELLSHPIFLDANSPKKVSEKV
jgi:hypothetical protein